MTVKLRDVKPGDVLCTRSKSSLVGRIIRFGAALRDEPNTDNHVVIAHHVDRTGTFWGIEGRPGGVGWADLSQYTGARNPYTVANTAQPKSDAQRSAVCQAAKGLIGTPYDWVGIAQDAMNAIAQRELWHDWTPQGVPGHVVCSSLADWVYAHVGLNCPHDGADRDCTPADWVDFIARAPWALPGQP